MLKKAARKSARRPNTVTLAIGVLAGLAAAPTGAQAGFLDQLFSGFQAAAPVVQPPAVFDHGPSVSSVPFITRRARRHVVVASSKPVLQKTTSLEDDKTLRFGDAVMMKDGLHVYTKSEVSSHSRGQFVSLDEARNLSSKGRVELASMDIRRDDPLTHGVAIDTIASGRSAAVGSPTVIGYRITDVRGASVRYVGP